MKHFITTHLRWCAFIGGLFFVLNAYSLNLKMDMNAIPDSDDPRYNDVIVTIDKIHHLMLNSQARWNIIYEDWETDKLRDSLYLEIATEIEVDGVYERLLPVTDTLKELTLQKLESYRRFNPTSSGRYRIVITPIRLMKNDKGDIQLIPLDVATVKEEFCFHENPLYKPSFASNKESIYEGEKVSLEVGTLPNEFKWDFSWNVDNDKSSGEVWNKTFNIDEVRAEKNISLTAICYAPDGKTKWYEETFEKVYTYIVYEKPVLTIDLTAGKFKDEAYNSEIIERNGVSYLLEGAGERDITLSMGYDKTKFKLTSVIYVIGLGNDDKSIFTSESTSLHDYKAGEYLIAVAGATWQLAGNVNEELPNFSFVRFDDESYDEDLEKEIPHHTIVLREKPVMRTVSWNDKTVHMWAGNVPEPLKIDPLDGASANGKYVWKVNGTTSSEGNNEQWTSSFSCTNGQVVDKVVSLTASYSDPDYSDIQWYEKEYKHIYKVYGTPVVKFNSSDSFDDKAQEYNHYSKETAYVDLNVAGGYSANWKYTWAKNKESIVENNRKFYTYDVRENKLDTVYCDTISVEFENRLPGNDTPYKESLTCYVKIWPEATVIITLSDSINVEKYEPHNFVHQLGMYNGFTRKVAVNMFGGNEEAWSCQWYKNNTLSGNEISDADGLLSIQETESSGVNLNETYTLTPQKDITYVCVATNILPNGKKLSRQYRIGVKVYPQPQVKALTSPAMYNLLTGVEKKDRKTFEVQKTGGYDNGWTFTWTDNDGLIESAKGSLTYEYIADNINEKPDTIIHKLTYSNVLDGEIGCQGEMEFVAVDYSTPVASVMNQDYAQQVRNEDSRTFSVTPPMGGNPDGWYYKWRRDYNDINTEWIKWENKNDGHTRDFVIYLNEQGEVYNKRTETHQYDFVYINLDGEGNELIAQEVVSFPVKIYRRPIKPTKIVEKGGGKSNLYILMYQVEQNVLEQADIIFDFYTTDGEHLYTGKDRAFFYRGGQKGLRGRSLWKYEDFDCYSDPVSVGSMEETKAPDCIVSVSNDSESASLPTTVTIYSITGETVKKVNYAMLKDYNETEFLQDVRKGMYVLHCLTGNQRMVKKVVVK